MLSVDDPGIFWSAELKVRRAYKHIQELEVWQRSDVEAYLKAIRANPNTGKDQTVVWLKRPPFHVCEQIGPIVGDIVHNLRAALDHVASEVVGRSGGDITRMYFPMNDSRDALIKTREFGLIERHAPHIGAVMGSPHRLLKTAL